MPNIKSQYPFPMKNNAGNPQKHNYNWFMEQENATAKLSSAHKGGDNKPQQISVVQFQHHGPPTVLTGTSISKGLTKNSVNLKNDATNDYWATKVSSSGGKKSRKNKKSRINKTGGKWQAYRLPNDPPTKVRFRWIDEYDTPSEDEN